MPVVTGDRLFRLECTDPLILLTAIVAHTSRPRPHVVNSGSSICRRDTPFQALAFLRRPANTTLHGESFQLDFLLALSSMRAPSVLKCRAFYV